ncbi:helix-turn-helix domain-containing protein [Pedobacter kyonggii]|uniref:Helix-turn-helix domain-containing protein n=1 Tax=Pedobacter kyonggii TaxID=1926871 RepID=A0A4Q9HFE1_9SPHI|nr:helix-turn-helix domain-containing protein [Pedobacter kyonggii]TBO43650.1 helix-turn-helix domain-containing protein [Pedobacter kyonggii]
MMIKNYGALLERSVRRSGFGISKLARKLKVSRPTVYQWFKEENLDALTIVKIENTIGVNSVMALEEIYGFSVQSIEPELDISVSSIAEDAEVRYWIARYIRLLEKYNGVLINKKIQKKCVKVW